MRQFDTGDTNHQSDRQNRTHPVKQVPLQTFQGERMTAALLDRLTHHSEIFEMNGESFRFKESMKQKKQSGEQD
jgi:IstB-like ATP binding protein